MKRLLVAGTALALAAIMLFAGENEVYAEKASPTIEWQKNRESAKYNVAHCIKTTADGGYVLGVYEGGDTHVIRLDSTGSVEWEKVFDVYIGTSSNFLQPTRDGGYVFCGYGVGNARLVKLDAKGIIQWEKIYNAKERGDDWKSVKQTADGGYIAAGDFGSLGTSDQAARITKMNESGEIEWDRAIKTNDSTSEFNIHYFNDVDTCPDGGYVVGGRASKRTEGKSEGYSYWVAKFDKTGNTQWQHLVGYHNGEVRTVKATSDGGCITAGEAAYIVDPKMFPVGGTVVIKYSSEGKEEWRKLMRGNEIRKINAIAQDENGDFLVVGEMTKGELFGTPTSSLDSAFWIAKFDVAGNTVWSKGFLADSGSTNPSQQLSSICIDKNGDYMVAGLNGRAYGWTDETETLGPKRYGTAFWAKLIPQDAERVVSVKANGNPIAFPDAKPYLIVNEGRVVVPVRFIAQTLGATVDWEAASRTVSIKLGNKVVRLGIDNNFADVNGEIVKFDSSAKLMNGRTYVPIRFVVEALNCSVDWDAETRTVAIATEN